MSEQMSKSEVHRRYDHVFVAPYCAWQNIVSVCNWEKVGYGCGVFGWNWDCFHIEGRICLVTGYRGFPKATVKVDETAYNRILKFEREAGRLRVLAFQDGYKRKRNAFRKRVVKYLNYLAEVPDEARDSDHT